MSLFVALSLVLAQITVTSQDDEPQKCAEPSQARFTHSELPGFEDAMDAVIGRVLEARVEYTWRAQRRGLLREVAIDGDCAPVLSARLPRRVVDYRAAIATLVDLGHDSQSR